MKDERTSLRNLKRVNKKIYGFFKDELNGKLIVCPCLPMLLCLQKPG